MEGDPVGDPQSGGTANSARAAAVTSSNTPKYPGVLGAATPNARRLCTRTAPANPTSMSKAKKAM